VFTESTETPSVDEQVRFDATNSQPGWNLTEIPITEYRWDFGDGSQVTTTTPIIYHTYKQAGTYYVTLTVYAPGTTPETDTSYPPQRKVVYAVPVGGYSLPIEKYTGTMPLIPYFTLVAMLIVVSNVLRRRPRRKQGTG